MSLLNESSEIKKQIKAVIRETVQEETKACFRVYPAVVLSQPDVSTGLCAVRLFGDNTTLQLHYSSAVASVVAGDNVLVAVVWNNMRNATVWQKIDFS